MNLDELYKAVQNTVVTPEMVTKLEQRLAEAEKKFAEESARRRVTQEWLNKEYTI